MLLMGLNVKLIIHKVLDSCFPFPVEIMIKQKNYILIS